MGYRQFQVSCPCHLLHKLSRAKMKTQLVLVDWWSLIRVRKFIMYDMSVLWNNDQLHNSLWFLYQKWVLLLLISTNQSNQQLKEPIMLKCSRHSNSRKVKVYISWCYQRGWWRLHNQMLKIFTFTIQDVGIIL